MEVDMASAYKINDVYVHEDDGEMLMMAIWIDKEKGERLLELYRKYHDCMELAKEIGNDLEEEVKTLFDDLGFLECECMVGRIFPAENCTCQDLGWTHTAFDIADAKELKEEARRIFRAMKVAEEESQNDDKATFLDRIHERFIDRMDNRTAYWEWLMESETL